MTRPYTRYRDSGVEWLGEVPSHWEVRPFRYVCRLAYGDSLASEAREDGDVPVFGSNGVVGQHSEPNTLAPVIVVGRKGSHGEVNFSECPAFAIDTTYFIDERFTPSDLRWLYYVLLRADLSDVSKDSAVPGLSRDDAYQKSLPLPPLDEQRDIAAYLDRETERVDALVAKKRSLLERLAEYRTALITRTVTKGLDPSVAMKDSGVEWLGEVPSHWDVARLLRVMQLKAGDSITSEQIDDVGEYPVFGGNGVRGFTDRHTHEGDFVLIGRQGALCGNINLARGKFWASEHAVVADALEAASVSWLARVLAAMKLNQYSAAAAQPGLALDRIKGLHVPRPPLDEQRAIAAFLDDETARIDGLSSQVETAIERLLEYRTALVTAAVTGKIDVRESTRERAAAK